ncbi:DNA-binding transcriptional LysR family regulator [Saccharopolyspora phatthalungensis]|uniref:DNA-binding transcriptional LysR family regulator n=1 Tax=Saccharopolyspora phatthalungensis TaxID=664693 RepID=A0A840PYG2_9PSEU|nr:DNA-binding transcriptional LysR family regulator [Saccharopolyspora phatthalungensis]
MLLAIREQGSVTRAAEQLRRTPPAVSQQLARLEKAVGAQLVERYAHGVRLTPLGTRLAEQAERIAAALSDATDEAARFRDEHRNRLRVGAFPTAGLALLPETLAALRHRHPGAALSVVDLGPAEGIDRIAGPARRAACRTGASWRLPLVPRASPRWWPSSSSPTPSPKRWSRPGLRCRSSPASPSATPRAPCTAR